MIITYYDYNVYQAFCNLVPNLKIIPSENFETTIEYETENPVQNAINKSKNHPSAKMVIICKLDPNKRFSFCPVLHNGILKQIKNSDYKKVIQQNHIPTKLLKQNSYFFSNFFHKNIYQFIESSKFPYDVTPCYKNKSKTSEDNYRPISTYIT